MSRILSRFFRRKHRHTGTSGGGGPVAHPTYFAENYFGTDYFGLDYFG